MATMASVLLCCPPGTWPLRLSLTGRAVAFGSATTSAGWAWSSVAGTLRYGDLNVPDRYALAQRDHRRCHAAVVDALPFRGPNIDDRIGMPEVVENLARGASASSFIFTSNANRPG